MNIRNVAGKIYKESSLHLELSDRLMMDVGGCVWNALYRQTTLLDM
jgi:hypothetical protein